MYPPPNEIVVTGEQFDRHFQVTIGGKPVWLPAALFDAFLALLAGRLSGGSPQVRLSSMAACRLRRRVGRAIGRAATSRLILTVGDGHYALGVGWRIAVAPDFRVCTLGAPKLNRRRAALLKLL